MDIHLFLYMQKLDRYSHWHGENRHLLRGPPPLSYCIRFILGSIQLLDKNPLLTTKQSHNVSLSFIHKSSISPKNVYHVRIRIIIVVKLDSVQRGSREESER
jgi:hypothetical protein